MQGVAGEIGDRDLMILGCACYALYLLFHYFLNFVTFDDTKTNAGRRSIPLDSFCWEAAYFSTIS